MPCFLLSAPCTALYCLVSSLSLFCGQCILLSLLCSLCLLSGRASGASLSFPHRKRCLTPRITCSLVSTCRLRRGATLEADTAIQLCDWEVFLQQTAARILQEQSPQRLLEVRGRLYELLTHCIPPDIILKVKCWKARWHRKTRIALQRDQSVMESTERQKGRRTEREKTKGECGTDRKTTETHR